MRQLAFIKNMPSFFEALFLQRAPTDTGELWIHEPTQIKPLWLISQNCAGNDKVLYCLPRLIKHHEYVNVTRIDFCMRDWKDILLSKSLNLDGKCAFRLRIERKEVNCFRITESN